MSGFSSATTTIDYGLAARDPNEQDHDNPNECVLEPGRGIAIGVFLSVPLWLMLAWTLHAMT
jgi:hypothetical protein